MRGKSKQETLLETNKEDREDETGGWRGTEQDTSVEIEERMVWNGQWWRGIWARESQTDRRNGVVAGSSG